MTDFRAVSGRYRRYLGVVPYVVFILFVCVYALRSSSGTLSREEMASVIGRTCTGCYEESATDCNQADEVCAICVSSRAQENPQNLTCAATYKNWLGETYQRCTGATTPPNNMRCVDEGSVTCWVEHNCNTSDLFQNKLCTSGTPQTCGTTINGYWCRHCSDGGLTGIEDTKTTQRCVTCGS